MTVSGNQIALPVLLLAGPQTMPGARTAGSLLLLGTLAVAVALVAFDALQRRVGPVRALLVSYLNPIVADPPGPAPGGRRPGPGADRAGARRALAAA